MLNDYLDIIFELKPNDSAYDSNYPWRGASKEQINVFKEKFFNLETSTNDKQELFSCLVQTRDIDTINEVYKYTLNNNLFNRPDNEQYLNYYLEDVGYTLRNGEVVSYCPNTTYHFSFEPDYFDDSDRKIFMSRKQHPTWCLQADTEKYRLGGILEDDETNPFFHFITFDTIPDGINIKGIERLVLGCHIRELNECGAVFYQHDENGYPVKINTRTDCTIKYSFDKAIKETFVRFAITPDRWKLQSWGSSNSRESLFRLGGEPTWIQGTEVLVCPICNEKMDFLMQLDTDLPDVEGGELMFGSGGVCYVFWCSKTKVSGYVMQCT